MKNKLIALLLFSSSFIQCVNFTFRRNAYATHQPVLYELTMKTKGPIIEFGCGDGSTELLHELCEKTGRTLISLDDNLEWLDKFRTKYNGEDSKEDNSGWHKFFFVPGKKDNTSCDHWVKFLQESELINSLHFSICFIDQSPWLARLETLRYLKHKTDYIIVHDCDYFPEHNVFGKVIRYIDRKREIAGEYDFSDEITNFKVYFPPHPWAAVTGPPTLVGSEFITQFPDVNFNKY